MGDLSEQITAKLLEDAAAGDEEAAGLLADFVYGWVEAVLKDSSLVDDASQEAFLAVLAAVQNGTFDSNKKNKASSWVTKVAINKAIDFRREILRRDARTEAEANIEELEDKGWTFEIERAIDVARVGTAIEALDKNDRAVILLYYYKDLSLQEVGDMLSIPVGTVKSRLSRAVDKLRQRMDSVHSQGVLTVTTRGKA